MGRFVVGSCVGGIVGTSVGEVLGDVVVGMIVGLLDGDVDWVGNWVGAIVDHARVSRMQESEPVNCIVISKLSRTPLPLVSMVLIQA